MRQYNFLLVALLLLLLTGCGVSKKSYSPNKKFTATQLQKDYTLLRNVLEQKHPGIYWYTGKDSMNFYFDSLYREIKDSMTELQFGWNVIAPMTQKLRCGHTSFSMSNGWANYIKDKTIPSFPYFLKIWGDTMIVTGSYNRKDSLIKKGTQITAINGLRTSVLTQKMFQYLPQDGFADNVNFCRISNNFPYYHRNIFGLYKTYRVNYIDEKGEEKITHIPMYMPVVDSAAKGKKSTQKSTLTRAEKKRAYRAKFRSLDIDTAHQTATLTLNTFSKGAGRKLKSFIKQSFKSLRQQQVKNLILDLRSNGGGDVSMYVLLTKYLRKTPFKVADTAYAVTKNLSPYSKLFKQHLLNNIGLFFFSKKKQDGLYHFGYWERHWFKPKVKNHYDGKLYVLINGPTFSASTLFCTAVKAQDNVQLIGEETGGGAYGNSGIIIPDLVLPNTQLKVRIPLFKIVQFNHIPQQGTGVMPDVYIPPTAEGIRKNIDRKMETVKGWIY